MKKILLIIFCFQLGLTMLYGQRDYSTRSKKAIKFYQSAREAFDNMQDDKALVRLEKALEKDDEFIEAYLLRAEIHRASSSYQKQVEDYLTVKKIDDEYFPYLYYNLGAAQLKTGKYENAKESLNQFLNVKKAREISKLRAQELIKQCDFAIQLINNPVPFNPEPFHTGVPDTINQYWPSLSVDEKVLVFTALLVDSTRKTIVGNFAHQEDFFYCQKDEGSWTKAKPLGKPINTPENEGAQHISADGTRIVYTACNREDGHGRCDIYFTYRTRNGWSRPVNAGPEINSKYSDKQPSLSPDGQILYFSSNRPGGYGGMDIWYAQRSKQGYFKEAQNMGELVNTAGDEISPYIHADNQTFYFSSDGHFGLGNKDIFFIKKDSNNMWQDPINIGYPINDYTDEIGLIINAKGDKAYYTADNDKGFKAIYQFDMPEELRPKPVSYVSGRIFDKQTGEGLEATFQLLSSISNDTIMQVTSNAEDGNYLVCLPAGQEYTLTVDQRGYLFYSAHFDLMQNNTFKDPLKLDIPLMKIEVGEKVVLNNIFFKTDSYSMLPQSNAELAKIVNFLNDKPYLTIEIGGHTDNTGTPAYNKELSEKRAKAVYDYLVKQGEFSQRLTYKGYGETEPIAPNTTEKGRALNRRTELKVTGKISNQDE